MPRGGKREGAGRPKRTDGREKRILGINDTQDEHEFIVENTTPDERREVLIEYIATKVFVKFQN